MKQSDVKKKRDNVVAKFCLVILKGFMLLNIQEAKLKCHKATVVHCWEVKMKNMSE